MASPRGGRTGPCGVLGSAGLARPGPRPPLVRRDLRPVDARADPGDGGDARVVLRADVGPHALLQPPADAALALPLGPRHVAGAGAADRIPAAGAVPVAVAGRDDLGQRGARRVGARALPAGLRRVLQRPDAGQRARAALGPAAHGLGAPGAALLGAAGAAAGPVAGLAAVPRAPPVGPARAALLSARAGRGRVLPDEGRPAGRSGGFLQPAVLVGLHPGVRPARHQLPLGVLPGERPFAQHDAAEPARMVASDHDQGAGPREVPPFLRPERADPLLHVPRHRLLRELRDLAHGRPFVHPRDGLLAALLLGDGIDVRELVPRLGARRRLHRLHAHPALHGAHLLQGGLRPRARPAAAPRPFGAGGRPLRAGRGVRPRGARARRGVPRLRARALVDVPELAHGDLLRAAAAGPLPGVLPHRVRDGHPVPAGRLAAGAVPRKRPGPGGDRPAPAAVHAVEHRDPHAGPARVAHALRGQRREDRGRRRASPQEGLLDRRGGGRTRRRATSRR